MPVTMIVYIADGIEPGSGISGDAIAGISGLELPLRMPAQGLTVQPLSVNLFFRCPRNHVPYRLAFADPLPDFCRGNINDGKRAKQCVVKERRRRLFQAE